MASASLGKDRLVRPFPPILLPHEVIGMLFTENAANSSLQHCRGPTSWNPREPARLIRRAAVQSQCLLKAGFDRHKPCTANDADVCGRAAPRRISWGRRRV